MHTIHGGGRWDDDTLEIMGKVTRLVVLPLIKNIIKKLQFNVGDLPWRELS